jgi:hypothetical protein
VFEKVTFLLDVGGTGCSKTVSQHCILYVCHGLYSSDPRFLFPYVRLRRRRRSGCVNSPHCFCYMRTVNMAYVQLKNGVLLENASVTTLSLLFLCSGCPMYSRPAYISCEKY